MSKPDNLFWCDGCKRVAPMADKRGYWACEVGHIEFSVYRECPAALSKIERITKLVMTPTTLKTIYRR